MTQTWPPTIPPVETTYSGDAFADAFNEFGESLKSGFLGSTAPAGITRGGLWSRDNDDGSVTLMAYDGSESTPVSLAPSHRLVGRSEIAQSPGLATASTSATSIGDIISHAPTVEGSFIEVTWTMHGFVEDPEDPRADVMLSWYDGSSYQHPIPLPVGMTTGISGASVIRPTFCVTLTETHGVSRLRPEGFWSLRPHGRATAGSAVVQLNRVYALIREYVAS